jgi:hypothetical protein
MPEVVLLWADEDDDGKVVMAPEIVLAWAVGPHESRAIGLDGVMALDPIENGRRYYYQHGRYGRSVEDCWFRTLEEAGADMKEDVRRARERKAKARIGEKL